MHQIENLYITRSFVKDKGDELVVLDPISIKKVDEIKIGQFLCRQLYSMSQLIRVIDSIIVKK